MVEQTPTSKVFVSASAIDDLRAELEAEGDGGYIKHLEPTVDIDGETYYPGPIVISYVPEEQDK